MPFISPTHRQDPPVIREPEGRCRPLLHRLDVACMAADTGFHVIYCNPAYGSLVGRTLDQLSGRCLLTDLPGFVGGACHRACLQTFQRGSPQSAEEVSHDRRLRARAYPLPEGVLAIIEEVTSPCQLEVQQKLDSLRVLAGGVAHDFNNLLTSILGTAEVLLRDLPATAPHRPLVELVKRSGEHAAELTRQLLIYAGKGLAARRPIDLDTAIHESEPLLRTPATKNVQLQTQLAAHLPTILADTCQLQRVIHNLVANAADALKDKGGTIRLNTGEENVTGGTSDLAPGKYVFLEVADDGCGIKADVLPRIFEPFFTTKAARRGLGLSVVDGIIRTHRGAIRVDSKLGSGTTVRVLLPVIAPTQTVGERSPDVEARRLVLVIDDEAHVRDVITRALAGIRLPVLAAGNGREGVELLERHHDEVGLVLLNLILPGMSAMETLTALRRLRPDLKIVLITGYDQDNARRLCSEWNLTGYLGKPYTLAALFEQVQHALGG